MIPYANMNVLSLPAHTHSIARSHFLDFDIIFFFSFSSFRLFHVPKTVLCARTQNFNMFQCVLEDLRFHSSSLFR